MSTFTSILNFLLPIWFVIIKNHPLITNNFEVVYLYGHRNPALFWMFLWRDACNSHELPLLMSVFQFSFTKERMPSRSRAWEEKGVQIVQVIQELVFWNLINLKCFFWCHVVVYPTNFYATSKKKTKKTKTRESFPCAVFSPSAPRGKRNRRFFEWGAHSCTVFCFWWKKKSSDKRGK